MRSWHEPTAAEVTGALARLGLLHQRGYFFDRLDNPLWVKPLQRAHAFDSLPDPVPADEPGYVSFPPWPEGSYLTRVARDDPVAVADVLKRVAGNDNPIVARTLFEAAAELPDSQLPELQTSAASWLRTPNLDWYADAAVAFILRSFEVARTEQALGLTRSLLAVQPDPRLEEKRARNEGLNFRSPLEPGARLSDWAYTRALEQVVPVAAITAGAQLVKLLSQLLHQALWHSRWDGDEQDASRYSAIWRPAIEDHDQNHDRDVRDALVSGLRDAAMAVIEAEPDSFDELVSDLLTGSILHQRIGLYVLSQSTQGIDIVAAYLSDAEFLDDHRFKHEIAQLMNGRWPDLDQDTRDRVLEWIETGDVERYRDIVEARTGQRPTDEEIDRHNAVWQRDRYSYIARHLTGQHKARYDALAAQFGEAEHADFGTWSASWVGTTGPVAQTDLGTWPIDRIVDYLSTWEPANVYTWPPGPTVEGLGGTLTAVTTARSTEFSQHATAFAEVDPTYVRALFDGLEAALKEDAELDWVPVLTLATSIANRPFEPDVEEPDRDRDRDPGYRWVRRHISSFIQAGLRDVPNRIGWEHREHVWAIIERLIDDPNPTPLHEDRYGGDNMDPLTLSLNTNRPYAIHTVVEYGLWCHRHLSAHGTSEPSASADCPEILPALDRHLDPEADPSTAVRATYGRWYAWLLLLDECWAISRAEAIFGPHDSPNDLGDVAWNTYILWTPPYDSAFRVLRRWYARQIDRLPRESTDRIEPMRSPHEKLGEHLTTFSWRGGDDNDLAARYFDAAPDNLAGAVTAFIGRTLANTNELSPAIGTRIQAHWERRMEVLRADPDSHRVELQAFTTWFASRKLDNTWALSMFEETLRLAGAPPHAKDALERLAEDDIDPVTAIRLLSLFIQRENNPWDNVLWRDPAKTILARSSEHPEARETTRIVVDYFVRAGDQSFREFASID